MKRPDAVVFLGPSLPSKEARALFPEATVRGPARQGDVLRALRERPRALVLVDGVFESQPSVWHQELRVALAEGVHVVGASSMGALRAVELQAFGMRGVGEVFRAYEAGRFVDDADVALLHADAEHDWRPLTVPFVNVVATAEEAARARVVTVAEARALVAAARRLHYHDRRWPAVLASLRWTPAKKDSFERFRRAHPVDVKAKDAREALRVARELCREPGPIATTVGDGLSVWVRRAWLAEQGPAPAGDADQGLRTLLLAEWGRSLGLAPPPERVAHFARRAPNLPLDPGLRRRFAEALALEELLLSRPGLVSAQAPERTEGLWLEALRRPTK